MARKGVAILREIAMVNSSAIAPALKVAMLKELNDELSALYAPPHGVQGELPLSGGPTGTVVESIKKVQK